MDNHKGIRRSRCRQQGTNIYPSRWQLCFSSYEDYNGFPLESCGTEILYSLFSFLLSLIPLLLHSLKHSFQPDSLSVGCYSWRPEVLQRRRSLRVVSFALYFLQSTFTSSSETSALTLKRKLLRRPSLHSGKSCKSSHHLFRSCFSSNFVHMGSLRRVFCQKAIGEKVLQKTYFCFPEQGFKCFMKKSRYQVKAWAFHIWFINVKRTICTYTIILCCFFQWL